MTDLREAEDISTGEMLDGRYRLEERIGEGGMARVYRAQDTHLHRTIAVKLLRGPVDGPETLERARAETRVLASLSHHSIVTVFDARISDIDGSYIAMEYIEGITLRDLIRRGPVDERDVARIAVDVAEGLHVAHCAGIVHRDVKPSNVLLGPSPLPGPTWRAKLADFGIAFLLDSTRLTNPGLVMGTAAYIAPEQAQGRPPAPPADIYAFGIMLIEALSGTRPYAEAEGIGALTARLISPPPIPETLSAEWQGLLRGMTAMRPDDRPTALEVALVLSRIAGTPATGTDADVATEAMTLTTDPTVVLPAAPAAPAAFAAGTTRAEMRGRVAAPGAGAAGAAGGSAPVGAVAARPVERSRVASLPETGARTTETDSGRRRRIVAAIVIAGLVALALVAAVWAMTAAGSTPEPQPSTPAVVPSVVPTEAPPEEEQLPPAENDDGDDGVVDEVVDDGGDDNSGPGNGEDPGNGGPGNGNGGPGNGNGNGNGGQGNGNGRGNGGGND